MLKVTRVYFGFALPRSVIGSENSRYFFNQSDAKIKTNRDLVARVFPRFRQFVRFYLSFHWLRKEFSFPLIGRCDSFGYGFSTLNRKVLYLQLVSILLHLQTKEYSLKAF